jgi:outer membrane protein OmpA-like peptidoglycan-associated protein
MADEQLALGGVMPVQTYGNHPEKVDDINNSRYGNRFDVEKTAIIEKPVAHYEEGIEIGQPVVKVEKKYKKKSRLPIDKKVKKTSIVESPASTVTAQPVTQTSNNQEETVRRNVQPIDSVSYEHNMLDQQGGDKHKDPIANVIENSEASGKIQSSVHEVGTPAPVILNSDATADKVSSDKQVLPSLDKLKKSFPVVGSQETVPQPVIAVTPPVLANNNIVNNNIVNNPGTVHKPESTVISPSTITNNANKATVTFNAGSVDLSPDIEKTIDGYISQKSGGDMSKISLTLVGYSSTNPPNPSVSRRVALQRVLAIRQYLISKGIASSKINVQALGDVEDHKGENVDFISNTQ